MTTISDSGGDFNVFKAAQDVINSKEERLGKEFEKAAGGNSKIKKTAAEILISFGDKHLNSLHDPSSHNKLLAASVTLREKENLELDTVKKLQNFESKLEKNKEIHNLKNYLGKISRQEAENLLKYQPLGSWIVRYSPNAKDYVLSCSMYVKKKKEIVREIMHISIGSNEMSSLKASMERKILNFYPKKIHGIVSPFINLAIKTSEQGFVQYLPSNKVSQRFKNIRCPEKTAIQVKGEYMHANTVTMPDGKRYIAAQAPVQKKEELWLQGALQEASMIIDVSSTKDRKLGVHNYLPNKPGETMTYGSLEVTCKETKQKYKRLPGLSFFVYTFVDKETGKTQEMKRLHYDQWLDYSDAAIEHLLKLTKIIDGEQTEDKPPLIHCKAGVGRTGTLIACLSNKHMADARKLTRKNSKKLTEKAILKGRAERSPVFVQTEDQLKSIHEFNQHVLKRIEEYESSPDFKGNIDTAEATKLLKGKPAGSWLIRYSQNKGEYFVTYKDKRNSIENRPTNYTDLSRIVRSIQRRV